MNFLDYDIFDDSYYEMKEQIGYYEKQLEILDNIFINNNVKSLSDLEIRLSNNINNKNKYDKTFAILEEADF